jgi:prepilin-type N-terminal cleavage/methylation domain-containing protein
MGTRGSRAGFTLIELLVVIAIIAILASLLLAGVLYVLRGKDDVNAANDINQLKLALQGFKQDFGIYPPGIVKLCSRRSDYTTTDPMSLDSYSVTVLNKMWNKLGNFGGGGTNPPAVAWDGVNVLAPGSYILLYGDQCLVYFLGGIIQNGTPTGFSNDPIRPAALGGGRKGPYYQFVTTRLIPLRGNNFPSYLDPYSTNSQGNPILYFCASIRNFKNGYFDPLKVPAAFPGAQTDKATGFTYITQSIPGLTDPFGAAYSQSAMGAGYLGINPFQTANNGIFPFFTTSNGSASPFSATFTCPAPDSFQIVCAGRDQVFGPGGQWSPATAPNYDLPGNPLSPTRPGQFDPANGNGLDDLTSFSDRRIGVSQ